MPCALVHAWRYEFLCDDALIALRYARNLVEHHELVYNIGERVEGFTSPLWVFLVSLGGFMGVEAVTVCRYLGGLAAAGTFAALWLFWRELLPARAIWLLLPVFFLATSTPFAAWTFGGLETPLFACLLTLSLALIARDVRKPNFHSAWQSGLAASLCTLCRPEGAVVIVVGACLTAWSLVRRKTSWSAALAWAAPVIALVGGYEVFRLSYYGYPLPNTFYVKTSGAGLWDRGLPYIGFAAKELGWPLFVLALAAVTVVAGPFALGREWQHNGGSRLAVWITCVATVIQVVYVARIGGDFLDLYRFLVPLLPSAFCLLSCGLREILVRGSPWARIAAVLATLGAIAFHLERQISMDREASIINSPSRRPFGLEPLEWTRVYGNRWRGIGRWLATIKAPGDSTAIGAAGSVPYYSGLPNLDLFGLNDVQIAHHGRVIGNRPGHQRFASMDYLLAKKPTFIFMNPELTPRTHSPLRFDRYWGNAGYVPIEIEVSAALCGCDAAFFHQFFVRRERAGDLRARPDVVLGNIY